MTLTEYLKHFIGRPYIWSGDGTGKTANGFDCSGLVLEGLWALGLYTGSDVTAKATYTQKVYTLTLQNDGHGTISASKTTGHKGDTVTLYKDGGKGFYFRTSSGCPAEGGLILHHTMINTPVGVRPVVYYGVHT